MFIVVFGASSLFAQFTSFKSSYIYVNNSKQDADTASTSSGVKIKEFRPRFALSIQGMYAFLDTELRFITPKGLFSFQVNFEDNLKMVEQSWIFSTSMIYRITESSGIYAMYYRLSRKHTFVLQDDIIVPDDTLTTGSKVSPFFNTEVYSLGYLFTILQKEKVFLGSFFNLYIMNINTGFESNLEAFNKQYRFLAPFPNFGLITDFYVSDWMHISGSIGIFFVNEINGVGGKINDFNFAITFLPIKNWGISMGFQVMDILVYSKEDDYKMEIYYNFKGPSVSINLKL